MTMHWAAKYLGIPYALGGDDVSGADCWGFVRAVLRAEKGLAMPALAIGESGNARAVRRCFDGWHASDGRAEFDIVTMKNPLGHHVGLVAKADKWDILILHCDKPQSCLARLSELGHFGYSDFRAWRYGKACSSASL